MFNELFFRSWWVIAFILFCAILYEYGLMNQHTDLVRLSAHLEVLQKQKKILSAKQVDLQARINSQSDPAWIELILIERLGLVPEGYKKVFFAP